ncbi:MAG TPA: hypothetical protein PKA88_09120 [Polyangiaceae bacterium]|nr:hypothetical protein [Polyangiaceae bacterium]HMR79272.1 hypothetical protein [Polyangiaceae bacterium]
MTWRRISSLLWLGLVSLLLLPFVDSYLTETQPRFVLIHVPVWLVLGYLAGRRFRVARGVAWNPLGLTGLVFFLGSLAFWMIPRSVDAAALSPWIDQLLHANLLAAGFAFAWSVPVMPFVLRAAIGIYGASMIFALGMLYTHYSALLCGIFTLGEQKQTGQWLLLLSAPIVIALLVSGYRALAREQHHLPAPS